MVNVDDRAARCRHDRQSFDWGVNQQNSEYKSKAFVSYNFMVSLSHFSMSMIGRLVADMTDKVLTGVLNNKTANTNQKHLSHAI